MGAAYPLQGETEESIWPLHLLFPLSHSKKISFMALFPSWHVSNGGRRCTALPAADWLTSDGLSSVWVQFSGFYLSSVSAPINVSMPCSACFRNRNYIFLYAGLTLLFQSELVCIILPLRMSEKSCLIILIDLFFFCMKACACNQNTAKADIWLCPRF